MNDSAPIDTASECCLWWDALPGSTATTVLLSIDDGASSVPLESSGDPSGVGTWVTHSPGLGLGGGMGGAWRFGLDA